MTRSSGKEARTKSMSGSLSIELGKSYFTAGEVVRGKLLYNPKVDRKIHGIHIHFTGFEFCENHILADVPYQKKWILDGSSTVFGSKCVISKGSHHTTTHQREEDGTLITAGNYSWPFSFQIPKNIPPSCDYKNGKVKIEYAVTALVDIPWAKSIRCVQRLRIGLPYVLDDERPPYVVKNEKSFLIHGHEHTTDAKPHILKMEASVDKPVTYTGDKLTVHVELDNNSGRQVHAIKVKLKQTWTYGTGYFEKFTISKVKHKDSKFPLGQGTYKCDVSFIVPNCELRPTIQNATLIKCNYHITVLASVRASGDLRVRVPVIVSSNPPVSKEAIPKMSETKQETKEAPKQAAPLIDWDAPVPEQQTALNLEEPLMPLFSSTPLQPTPSTSNPFEDFTADVSNFDAFKPNDAALNEIEFNKHTADLSETTAELDNAIHWASAGQLQEAVDFDPGMTPETAKQLLINSLKAMKDAVPKLVTASQNKQQDQFREEMANVTKCVHSVANNSKNAATQISDRTAQQGMLSGAKGIAIGSNQLLLQSKEVLQYDPFSSVYALEFLVQNQSATATAVKETCDSFIAYVEQVFGATNTSVVQLNAARNSVESGLADFENPFGGAINQHATLEDVERSALSFAGGTSQFVFSCHGNPQDAVLSSQSLTQSLSELLINMKGASASINPTVAETLKNNAKAAAIATSKLLAVVANAMQQSSLANAEKDINTHAREMHQAAASIITVARSELKRLEEAQHNQEEKSEMHIEDFAQLELTKAAEAIMAAAEKLRQILQSSEDPHHVHDKFCPHNVNHKYDVIDASSTVAGAIGELMQAASVCQSERVQLSRDTKPDSLYHRDPTWTEGLISAAKTVVALIEQLVTAISAETLQEEVIIGIARAINGATAQLLSAERAKGDPDSEGHKKLSAAAKLVTRATTELVEKAKEAAHHTPAPSRRKGEEKEDDSATAVRVKELEAAARIARLEKELELARQDMGNIRKARYEKP